MKRCLKNKDNSKEGDIEIIKRISFAWISEKRN